ncbi:MAG: hypothetical protein A2W61_01515 [Deltaproteobacteria bacterium RIFCSPLOWO2_01_44_7]|nr:MAG: hypothetical protein A2712_02330 [Deltaproteobacteria bacterium RIFCSPHIGHO2_01_FULL_43_49]OGQ15039.1 MAG: hypothetical protein A3D22_03150 [Deltaproteobacteria bacterium RIFCSPHIGHO2_02_FULL_44_53]OGQ27342.1 MAG: hypothetical protein A3D98_02925 [Deltaproteobacteria bacterium RIFCSPHIGHO2_12_FULL_44_21]OGQ31556.1 MAG: hypothetical protein A2979_04310 [Deltaproteobacteria bacterium RIFCSPLOWO2_01_FULL_45_74]OGQ38069.1 MAG: hypothetical protein A2W61_01515 [Deltaproteobacteria bacterium 
MTKLKVIVTTTINPPTQAIKKFEQMEGWELIVVGDLKTPEPYSLEHGRYVSPAMQEKYDKSLSDAIGWNCIQRRNFGLLWAKDMGADIVAVVDDDNIPYHFWGRNLMVGREVEVNFFETELPAFDPVGATNEKHLWHRGYPLQLIPKRDYSKKRQKRFQADVQADFWNGDPDVDAICRMEHAPQCQFEESYFPMASNRIAPFNSQNTFLSATVLKDYFLFPHVGRMDDIWAAYYVQAKGVRVVFGKASVYQNRNTHDLVENMKQEYLGYENNLKIVEQVAKDPECIIKYLPSRSAEAFRLYRRHF